MGSANAHPKSPVRSSAHVVKKAEKKAAGSLGDMRGIVGRGLWGVKKGVCWYLASFCQCLDLVVVGHAETVLAMGKLL